VNTEARRRLTYALGLLDLCLIAYLLHVISKLL